MLLMADDGTRVWPSGGVSTVDQFEGGDDELVCEDHMSIDLESLLSMLDEDSDHAQGNQDDQSSKNLLHGNSGLDAGNLLESQSQSGAQVFDGAITLETDCRSYNIASLDTRPGALNSSYVNNGGRPESSAQTSSPAHTCSASFKDWNLLGQGSVHEERVGLYHIEMPSSSTSSSFIEGYGIHASDHVGRSLMENEAGRHAGDSKYASARPVSVSSAKEHEYYGGLSQNSVDTLRALENSSPGSTLTPFVGADTLRQNVTPTESTIYHNTDVISDFSEQYSSLSYCFPDDSFFSDSLPSYIPNEFYFQNYQCNEDHMNNIKDHFFEFPTESACSSTMMAFNTQGTGNSGSISELPIGYSDVKGQNIKSEDSSYASVMGVNSFSNADCGYIEDTPLSYQYMYNQLGMLDKKQLVYTQGEQDSMVSSRSMVCPSVKEIDETVSRQSYYGVDDRAFVAEDIKTFVPGVLPSTACHVPSVQTNDDQDDTFTASYDSISYCRDFINENVSQTSVDTGNLNSNISEHYIPDAKSITLSKRQLGYVSRIANVKQIDSKVTDFHLSKVSPESIHSNSHTDDDPDVCIIEDTSKPVCPNRSLVPTKSNVITHHSAYGESIHYPGRNLVPTKSNVITPHKPNDERLIFRVALQDLSQPKSEANLPDGVLTVSLLRHQRIALSWMVQKETASIHCLGGILADDQGLGKTISTIALILKEKPSSLRTCAEDSGRGDQETLNLDDDDDVTPQHNGVKQESDCCKDMSNGGPMKSDSLSQVRGRPAAGTLVVCPTSVLRQWADELQNKVSSESKLSVLVYHGSNRTKDPSELAKYDVVITTYSIVSMEVPKQPFVDDDEKRKGDSYSASPMAFSSNKKRKYPPSSDKIGSKHKKGVGVLLDSATRPLARVGWFRVVLDEAQSIKNYRTQVARACWGLRAKRRWCLSGTPIQNAIDDLYSYFRFLRYEPYAVYKLFCSTIKFPITRNPAKGYKKLQAVLKTIMLRRTKGTLLDGEPIISLPPKTVELKKVDFTMEERDFYSRLESDSRDQFKEYAEAGTVKQNYVNILLMLLRLRQACDHPLLVKGFDSNSLWKSSVDIAKKLPLEKQAFLLNCLEASLAICGICNDPPEDAVASICGHVFCKQCICEHLTGIESQCPTRNCKTQLSVSSVFSKETLNRSLHEMHGQDTSVDSSIPEPGKAVQPCFVGRSSDSSKIKAALQVLQSLSQTRTHTLADKSPGNNFSGNDLCLEHSSDHTAEDKLNNVHSKEKLSADKCTADSVKTVGEKAIVFSQWTRMLDLLEACLKSSSIQYRRLDGTMSVAARDKAVKDFNTLPEVSVMIMSLKAASLGLNMVAACHVLLLDLWWNPTTEDQAIDRAHRIGQTRPVRVLRLTVKDTVEDRILALQQKKRVMVASAFGEDESGSQQTRLTVDDLKYLFMA